MFDKWVNQDIGKVLARRNRVVVGAEASLLDLLRKVLPKELTIFVVHGALEELECKYTVEKFHKDDKVVIIATAPKNELTFIRDYADRQLSVNPDPEFCRKMRHLIGPENLQLTR